jgi:hypothetical protein
MYEVRHFHRLASFYRKFIRNSSSIFSPILDNIKKEHPYFNWTREAEKGFIFLKEKITKHPILVLPEFQKPFKVRCDASGVAIGVFLSQGDKNVSYFSEKLNDTKKKYSTYDKEFYAVIHDLKKWRHYLMPREFILYIDNHALQFITKQEKLKQKQAKWVELMQNFTFVIKHINGIDNKVADDLSRRCLILWEYQVNTLGFEHLKEMYKEDPDLKEAYEACENTVMGDRIPWLEYIIKEGWLFKESQL